jgi:phage terminase small subunit
MSNRKVRAADEKRARFAAEYCVDLNGAAAAIRAGYAPKSAKVTASRLLTDANLAASIRARLDRMANKAELTPERVMRALASLCFSDVRSLFDENNNLKPMADLTPDQAAAISGIESEEIFSGSGEDRKVTGVARKIKLWNKVGALAQAAAVLGMTKPVDPAGAGLHVTIRPWSGRQGDAEGDDA